MMQRENIILLKTTLTVYNHLRRNTSLIFSESKV
uniref:Uncharacterized protein n=1 Tax=Arundo donax TaxID=35708 RepID=A0A0A9C8R9_ARUDO